MEQTYFRRGFGLKQEIEGALAADYASRLVEEIRARGYTVALGDLTVRVAREFGFCYGVDRAVEYAYETRRKFPDKRVFLVGEIIHNPHVNDKLRAMGIEVLRRPDGGESDFSSVTPQDVVLLPAFGVTVRDFQRLRDLGCVLVDTTCGSVLNVWKRVESYARDGFTAVIHGKYYHEETKATSSQVTKYPGGKFLVVRNMDEAREVCDYIEGRGERTAFLEKFAHAASPGFDPDRDLARIGVANQTTVLANESLAIAAELRQATVRRHGEAYAAEQFRNFDTICSATQERQDAVIQLLEEPPDLMIVVGGYNSSNTTHLATICQERVRTFHIEDAACIDALAGTIRHQPVGTKEERAERDWLPPGRVTVGLTAGASTPNNKIGETIERLAATRGIGLASVLSS